jgi:hypothetical protein
LELAIRHKQAPIALDIFVGAAGLLMAEGTHGKAVELLSTVLSHPACYFETKENARRLLDDTGIDLGSTALDESHGAADWQIAATELIEMLAN